MLVDTLEAFATRVGESLNQKQNKLISGVTIKTVNNQSILGEGNFDISADTDISMLIVKSSESELLNNLKENIPFILVKENDLFNVPTYFIGGIPIRFGYKLIFKEDCFATKLNNKIKYIEMKEL